MLCWPFTSGQKKSPAHWTCCVFQEIAIIPSLSQTFSDTNMLSFGWIERTWPNHCWVRLFPPQTTINKKTFILKAKQQIGQFSHHSALSKDGSGGVGMEDSNGGSKVIVGDSGSAFWRLSWNKQTYQQDLSSCINLVPYGKKCKSCLSIRNTFNQGSQEQKNNKKSLVTGATGEHLYRLWCQVSWGLSDSCSLPWPAFRSQRDVFVGRGEDARARAGMEDARDTALRGFCFGVTDTKALTGAAMLWDNFMWVFKVLYSPKLLWPSRLKFPDPWSPPKKGVFVMTEAWCNLLYQYQSQHSWTLRKKC